MAASVDRRRLVAAAIAALYLIALFPLPEFPAYNSDDGSFFVTLALNVVDHGRYSTDTWPGSPFGHHATWPPLHPLLLAAVISVAGLSWVAVKGVMALLGLLGLYLWWRLLRNEPGGPAAVLALSLSPAYFLFSHHPMTEVPFMVLCAAVLLALRGASTPMRALSAGLLAAVAFMVRGYGVAFLPAAMIWFGTRTDVLPRRRLALAAAFAVPMLVAVIGWQQYTSQILRSLPLDAITAQYGNGTGLSSVLDISAAQHLKNLSWFELRYPAHFVAPFVPLEDVLRATPMFALSMFAVGLAGVGWASRMRAPASPGDIWAPCMALLLYVLAAHTHGIRYWITLLPFGLLYLFNGFRVVAQWAKMPVIASAGTAVVTLSVAAGLAVHFWQPDRLRFSSSHWKEYRDIALWAAHNLPADAAVVAHASHKFHAITRLVVYPAERADSVGRAAAHRDAFVLCGEDDRVPAGHRGWCAANVPSKQVAHRAQGLVLIRLR